MMGRKASPREFVPNMLKMLGRKRMTAPELSVALNTKDYTAKAWADALVETGFLGCEYRLHQRDACRKPLEYWLLSCWGGEA